MRGCSGILVGNGACATPYVIPNEVRNLLVRTRIRKSRPLAEFTLSEVEWARGDNVLSRSRLLSIPAASNEFSSAGIPLHHHPSALSRPGLLAVSKRGGTLAALRYASHSGLTEVRSRKTELLRRFHAHESSWYNAVGGDCPYLWRKGNDNERFGFAFLYGGAGARGIQRLADHGLAA